MKSISVVIPTHNRADMLRESLDGILAQSHQPIEVIVVDDGSTDHTADVLAGYAARGVQAIRIPKSRPLAARNVGLRAARGELIAFCDSDDLWRPRFLETAATLWEHVPTLRAAYSNFVIVQSGDWAKTTKFDAAPAGYWDDASRIKGHLAMFETPVHERLIRFQPFFPSCMVVDRTTFVENGGWDEATSGLVGCDFATALREARHGRIGLMLEPLVGIRKHAGNLSADNEAMNLGNALVLEHVLRTLPGMDEIAETVLASVAARRRDALALAFVRRDMEAVRRIYGMLPPHERKAHVKVKAIIASLPTQISRGVAHATLRLGTAKTRLLASTAASPVPRLRIGGDAKDTSHMRIARQR